MYTLKYKQINDLTEYTILYSENTTEFTNIALSCNIMPSNLKELIQINITSGINFTCFTYNCINLVDIPTNFNTKNGTIFTSAFANCESLTGLPDLFNIDSTGDFGIEKNIFTTKNSINLDKFCYNCSTINELPEINCNAATSLIQTFTNCYEVKTFDILSTQNVKDFTRTFENCYNGVNFPTLDYSSAIHCDYTFTNCSSVPILELSNINNCDTFIATFNNCTNLQSLGSTFNDIKTTSGKYIKSLSGTFTNCYLLTSYINITTNNISSATDCFKNCYLISSINFTSLENCIYLSGAFWNCYSLISANLININKIENFNHIFDTCSSLLSSPIFTKSNYIETSEKNIKYLAYGYNNCYNLSSDLYLTSDNIETLEKTFANCYLLSSINFSNTLDNLTTSGLKQTFYNCINLTSNIRIHIKNNLVNPVNSLFQTFYNCNKLKSIILDDLTNIDTTSGFIGTFQNCISLTNLSFNNNTTNNVKEFDYTFSNCEQLQSLPNLSASQASSMQYTFDNCIALTNINISNINNVKYFTNTFTNCSSLVNITNFNTYEQTNNGNIVNLDYAFTNCKKLNQSIYITTKNVSSLIYCFSNCEKLTDIYLTTLSNVENLSYTFAYCTSLSTFNGFNNFNFTSNKLKYLDGTFINCIALTGNSLDNKFYFDTTNVESMSGTFKNCSHLSAIEFKTITNCENLDSTFQNCSELTGCNLLSNFDQTSNKLKSLNNTFENCSSLAENIYCNGQNISSMNYTFANCYKLPIINFSNKLSNCINLEGTFKNCSSLTELFCFKDKTNRQISGNLNYTFYNCIKLNHGFNISDTNKITSLDYTFTNNELMPNIYIGDLTECSSLLNTFTNCKNANIAWRGNLFPKNKNLNCSALFYNCQTIQSIPSCNLSYSQNCLSTFANCYKLTNFSEEYFNFKFPSATTIAYMFANCSSINTNINIGQTKKVKDMTNMFKNCYNLKSINNHKDYKIDLTSAFANCLSLEVIPQLDCTNVESLKQAFTGCSKLQNVNNIINTKYVKDMTETFSKCIELTEIPSTFCTDSAQKFSQLFYRCTKLKKIPVINCKSIRDNNFSYMFYQCENLTNIDLLHSKTLKSAYAMFTNCTRLQKITGLDTSNCINADSTFAGASCLSCINTTEYPTLDFSNISSYGLYSTFYNCFSLSATQNFGLIENSTRNVRIFDGTFYYSKIKSINGHTWEDAKKYKDPFTHDENGNELLIQPLGTTFGFCTSSAISMSQLVYGGRNDPDVYKYIINLDLRNIQTFRFTGYGPTILSGLQFSNKLINLKLTDNFLTYMPDEIPTQNVSHFSTLFGDYVNGQAAFSLAPFINHTDAYPSGIIHAGQWADKIPEYHRANGHFTELYTGNSDIPFFPKLNTKKGTSFERMYFYCRALKEIKYCLDLSNTQFMYINDNSISGILNYAWELDRFYNMDYANFDLTYTNYRTVENKEIYTYINLEKGAAIISSITDKQSISIPLNNALARNAEILKNGSLLRNIFYNCYQLSSIQEILGIKYDINFCFTKLELDTENNSIGKVISALNTSPQGPLCCLYLSHNEFYEIISGNETGTSILPTLNNKIYTTTNYEGKIMNYEKIYIPENIESAIDEKTKALYKSLYNKIPYHEFNTYKGQYILSGDTGWTILSCFTPEALSSLPCKKHLLSAYLYEKIF